MANTQNLGDFGKREQDMAGVMLIALSDNNMTENAKEHFDETTMVLEFNPSSGNVFLADDNCNVLMMREDKLDLFLSLPYEGKEGFVDELFEEWEELCDEDKDVLVNYLSKEQDKKRLTI